MTASPSATRHSRALREIWNGARYREFRAALLSDQPARRLRRLRTALEPVMPDGQRPRVAARHPDPQRRGGIAGVVAAIPRGCRRSRSSSSTAAAATAPSPAPAPPAPTSSARRGAVTGAPAGPAPRRRPTATSSCFSMATAATARRLIPLLVAPLAEGRADFVIGSRTRGTRERGSMNAHQLFAGYAIGAALASALWRALYRYGTVARDPPRRAAAASACAR